MGTHPSLPSVDVESNQTLNRYLITNPAMLSGRVYKQYEGALPFLLKVLSIERPLCIQAHPDRDLAARLHAEDSSVYPGEYRRFKLDDSVLTSHCARCKPQTRDDYCLDTFRSSVRVPSP